MPIVDGLASCKMIRSFEKSHPTQLLSSRAALNGRTPIVAVSASLQERSRSQYIQAGFDAWLLKPISIARLSEIMEGLVDQQVRQENLYQPGSWERGGWFEEAQRGIWDADTKPNQEPVASAPSEGAKIAAASDGPAVKEEDESVQSKEQKRLLEVQEKGENVLASDEASEAKEPHEVESTAADDTPPETTEESQEPEKQQGEASGMT